MTESRQKELLDSLSERAKELNCLYQIEELLKDYERPLSDIFHELVQIIPQGWQFPNDTSVRIQNRGDVFESLNFLASETKLQANMDVQNENVGYLEIYYHGNDKLANPFLPEEQKLLSTIAQWVSHYLYYRDLNTQSALAIQNKNKIASRNEWQAVVEMIRKTDSDFYLRLSRKMMNYLCWLGIPEARHILQSFAEDNALLGDNTEENKPGRRNVGLMKMAGERIFELASHSISDEEILNQIKRWFQQDKIMFFLENLENLSTSMSDLHNALTRFSHLDKMDISEHTYLNLKVLLIYRFFTEQPEFINIAKHFVDPEDFYDLIQHIIYPSRGQGKLGGKAAGIFLATSILKSSKLNYKTPKTWYITSNALLSFLNYNNLREIIEQKYKNGEQIREEYPNIIQIFKNSYFSPEITKGLQQALNDFGEKPLIVRSSSLLEDRIGATFSGKYKSLFLANQGTYQERLAALMDAITEVYASTFGPDPIEYRKERNLLDFHEEMAILIQEVVGVKAGKYFFPAFAGVAFSYNEFRWSPRLERDNGLLRLVPGLGTRAVDRIGDEYPLLLAPGQPSLRVNTNPEEISLYSPHRIDVIDLEENTFVTHDLDLLLKEIKDEFPQVEQMFSVYNDGTIVEKTKFGIDFEKDTLLFTMNSFLKNSPFLSNMRQLLNVLREKIGIGVDIEFAHDGKDLYILQCRGQGLSSENAPSLIPQDINEQNIIFNANTYISNGAVPEILHIVYVDPAGYKKLTNLEDLKRVGRAIGQLNGILPKRKFILMGPGRWGSKGDIKLGVKVTYSDINNTAMLIEIARCEGGYLPDLSFGTHFFQDLVEASIRYLPLYPDNEGIIFNDQFLDISSNILSNLLPEYADLEEVIKVIDVQGNSQGKILRVLMNADLNLAIAYLDLPTSSSTNLNIPIKNTPYSTEAPWVWRLRMAEAISNMMDGKQFGVKAIYLIGSTKNANAGPASDIDLLLHFTGNAVKRRELLKWLEGWGLALAEMNFLKTGYRTDSLLDVHLVTDHDISEKTSYAVKIGAITDAARLLKAF